ncbi:MAG TPA: DnaA/Hda family protein [Burkholderiales bacterium]|nr:DnaA/Hda family protein [Burkholderiales bacterium]
MRQLPLGISPAAEPAFDNFVAGRNAEALARVRDLAQGTLRERIVYLWGEVGTGRTHLLRAAAHRNPSLVVADDVQLLDGAGQHALFVAINDARDTGNAVLAAGDLPPAQLALREDLRTRLAWGLVYQLLPLADEDKARHLKAVAASRGLQLSDDIVDYLLSRLPRDMRSLQSMMEVLDQYSLMRKRPLTLPLVREALAEEILGRQPRER